jgi:hypothetical protein
MILLDDMKETLVSISELCKGGLLNKQNIVVFTWEGMRAFEMDEVSRNAMKNLHDNGTEIVRAYQENGVYVLNRNEELSNPNKNKDKNKLFLAQFKPVSLYDHVHLVTGHPGKEGMKWHLENSRHAKYTESDAQRQRGTCKGCVYGTMTQMGTDHNRLHRDIPTQPGQCFSLDAYSHTSKSFRGYKFCDLFTDLATRCVYPVFTKDRSANYVSRQINYLNNIQNGHF